MKNTLAKVSLVATGAYVAVSSAAHAEGLIPDTGVDMSTLVTEGITMVGTVVAVCAGGAFAFMAIKAGIRWARSAFHG